MASPISIGDALLLGKIALRLGRTFTSGRKSAPAEFREVENQLYALSTALSALEASSSFERQSSDGSNNDGLSALFGPNEDGAAVLAGMLANCRETLTHLEEIVKKYAKLRPAGDAEASVFRRWSRKLAADVKKIGWTTEGGDLATLRSQLMVHINSINAVFGVINNLRGQQVQDNLSSAMRLLKEIRSYVDGSLNAGSPITREADDQVGSVPPLTGASFQLYLRRSGQDELICDRARLILDWDSHGRHTVGQTGRTERHGCLFMCTCPKDDATQTSVHDRRLGSLRLSPFTFAMRLADPSLSWLIYKVSDQDTGSHIEVSIRGMSPKYMMDVSDLFVKNISLLQARRWLSQGQGTVLAFSASDQSSARHAYILDLVSDTTATVPFADSLSISISGRDEPYTRSDIQDIQITHHSQGSFESFAAESPSRLELRPHSHAEIVIYLAADHPTTVEDDVVKMTLKLRYDTSIVCSGDGSVVLTDIHCTGTTAAEYTLELTNSRAEIRFSERSAAMEFRKRLRDMCRELSLILMKYPRHDEVIVMKLQAGGVHTEDVVVGESDITIAQNVNDGSFRLLITSHDMRTVVSQKLPDGCFGTKEPSFHGKTYISHWDEKGELGIRSLPTGFRDLVLSDISTTVLLKEWTRSQLWQRTLPSRSRAGQIVD